MNNKQNQAPSGTKEVDELCKQFSPAHAVCNEQGNDFFEGVTERILVCPLYNFEKKNNLWVMLAVTHPIYIASG